MQEFMYDEFNQYQYGFRTLEPGDTLKIKDTITDIYYDDWEETTYIQFVGGGLPFDGDLTKRFNVYDEVIITLHIIEISDYNYSFEYFEEGWDGDSYVPFPSSSIKLA